MQRLKYILLFVFIFSTVNFSLAQIIADPTTWKLEVKKKSVDSYQLIFHLNLKEGWHVYEKVPGMDESLIVPSFTFNKSSNYTLVGPTTAKGMLTTKKIEGIGPVGLYTDKVIYVQNITAKKGTTVSGTYTYQTCNDNTCLPPKKKTFSVVMK